MLFFIKSAITLDLSFSDILSPCGPAVVEDLESVKIVYVKGNELAKRIEYWSGVSVNRSTNKLVTRKDSVIILQTSYTFPKINKFVTNNIIFSIKLFVSCIFDSFFSESHFFVNYVYGEAGAHLARFDLVVAAVVAAVVRVDWVIGFLVGDGLRLNNEENKVFWFLKNQPDMQNFETKYSII